MRKNKTYAMKNGGKVVRKAKGGAIKKRMMAKGGPIKKFKPGGAVPATSKTAKALGAAMGAGAVGAMAGMTVAKATKFLKNKGFNVSKKTKGPR